ncbi:MAG TPA: alpha-hydroxy acid oxidase [Ktedonobacteraceae bacterium]|nr:alpha-hydroxy acid oxidase [Ktedonobacteraceae bacterium]
MDIINLFDYENLAATRLELATWSYYAGGSNDEVTLRANREAFARIRLRPRMLVDVSSCDCGTTVLGTSVSLPVLVAPSAFHALADPAGECATAQAAGAAGTVMVASSSSSYSLEEIAQASSGPLWFQLYVFNRPNAAELVQRAAASGYRALVLTVDSPQWGQKERGMRSGFQVPVKGNVSDQAAAQDAIAVTWDDIDWLRSLSPLPLILKGILTAEDAELAVAHGVEGIIVSNHGGRQLDGVAASIEALSEVVEAVNSRCEVYMDGGIRRGTDVLKALALGARAVLIGRPILWGLAVQGKAGAQNVLEILHAELELAMALAGCPDLASIKRSLVRLP